MSTLHPLNTTAFPYPFGELLHEGFLLRDGETALRTLLEQCESLAAVVLGTASADTGELFGTDALERCAPTIQLLYDYLTFTRALFAAWTEAGKPRAAVQKERA